MVKSAKKFRTLPADNTLHVKQYNKCTTLKFTYVFYSKPLIHVTRTSAAQQIWMIKYLEYRRLFHCWSYPWRNRWGKSKRSLCSPPHHCHSHSHLSIKHKNLFTSISISLLKEVQKQLPRKDHSVNEFIVKSDNKLENFIKLKLNFLTCWVFITIDAWWWGNSCA